ncbi:hypothetical protein Tco_1149006 [Tanacetum coccineum]
MAAPKLWFMVAFGAKIRGEPSLALDHPHLGCGYPRQEFGTANQRMGCVWSMAATKMWIWLPCQDKTEPCLAMEWHPTSWLHPQLGFRRWSMYVDMMKMVMVDASGIIWRFNGGGG